MLGHDFIEKLKGVSRDHVNDADQLVALEGDEDHQVSQQAIANYYALDALLHACGIGWQSQREWWSAFCRSVFEAYCSRRGGNVLRYLQNDKSG